MYKDRYIFTLAKKDYWKKRKKNLLIDYSAVGGRVEEDETILNAIHREAKEEINCDISLISAKSTIYLNPEGEIKKIELKEKIKPLLIFEKNYPGKPGFPDAEGQWYLFAPVFIAEPLDIPKPSSEVPAIICLNKDLFFKIPKIILIQEFIDLGGILIEVINIPRDAYLVPTFAAEILMDIILNESQ